MNRQLFRYHANLGYTFVPGLKTRVDSGEGGYLVRVNQAGFRSDSEFQPWKREGVFRILLFGDSFSAADGVSNKHRYSDVLPTLLPGVEVFNFALPGTGTDQQYLTFQEFAPQYDHDLVVIGILVENIRRIVAKYRTYAVADGSHRIFAKPYFQFDQHGNLVRFHNPVPKDPLTDDELPAEERQSVDRGGRFEAIRKAVSKLGPKVKDFAQRVTHYQPLPAYDSPEHPDWLLMKGILTSWIAESEKPVVLFTIPLYQHIEETSDPSGYQARFRELAEATGAIWHDPLPDYLKTPRAERRSFRFGKDIHPTPASHRLLAESLARCLQPMVEHAVT